MLNYLAKYSIAECLFQVPSNNFDLKDVRFIGIFSLTKEGMYEIDLSTIDVEMTLKRAIGIESRLGGGIGFPTRDRAMEIMMDDHADFITSFIDTISQERIVLFDDGERYVLVMMEIILKLAKEAGKQVICISAPPPKFEGRIRRRDFDESWQKIEYLADETLLYDFSSLEKVENLTISDLYVSRRAALMQKIHKEWTAIRAK